MTMPPDCGCDDCCEDGRPVFLGGGDELAVRLRELAFGALLITKEPVEPATLARLAGSEERHFAGTLDGLARAGRIDRDERGRVLGSAGLTLGDAPHGLAIDGHPRRGARAPRGSRGRRGRNWELVLAVCRRPRRRAVLGCRASEPRRRLVGGEHDWPRQLGRVAHPRSVRRLGRRASARLPLRAPWRPKPGRATSVRLSVPRANGRGRPPAAAGRTFPRRRAEPHDAWNATAGGGRGRAPRAGFCDPYSDVFGADEGFVTGIGSSPVPGTLVHSPYARPTRPIPSANIAP